MTMLERTRFSVPAALGPRGSGVFDQVYFHGNNGGRGICGLKRRSRLLRQMALEGKSASTIAAVLGAPSRNAVIGKANRIGVKLTGNIH